MTDTHVRDEEARQIRSESGFTLVELLIVIVILGILTAVVVFSVGGLRNSGNLAACRAQEKTAQIAVEAYNGRMGTYPGYLAAPVDTLAAPAAASTQDLLSQTEATSAMTKLLTDQDPAAGNSASARLRLLKEAPLTGGWGAAVSIARGATPALPTENPTSTSGEGSFVAITYTPANTAAGSVESSQMDVFGYYNDGGVVKAC